MNIVLVGSDYFRTSLRRLGARVTWIGSDAEADIRVPEGDFHLPTALSRLPDSPDAVIATDHLGRRLLPSGLDEVAALKVWYGVDGPLNAFWHDHYAFLFDLVLADQKDCAERLSRLTGRQVRWLPVAVDTDSYGGPPESKLFDIAFVGVINDHVRPKRSRIVDRLSRRYSVKTAGGRFREWVGPREAARLYRQARLVLNENLFDGVTTRMFEALASGGMLLTEAARNGFADIFQPGRHLDVFHPDDLFDQVDRYLRDDRLREKVAAEGRQLATSEHDIRRRAEFLLHLIASAKSGAGVPTGGAWRLHQGMAWLLAGLRWPAQGGPRRIMEAEKLLLKAAHLGVATPESLFHLGAAAWIKGSRSGARVRLGEAAEAGEVRGWIGLGRLTMAGGSPAEAANYFQRAAAGFNIEFPAGSAREWTADGHYWLGQILERAGHVLDPGFSRSGLDPIFWNAAEHYQAALSRDPDHALALGALGRILAGHGAFVEAYPLLDRARTLAPGDETVAALAESAARHAYLDKEAA